MLFERRAYTLRPGSEDAFWQLQRKFSVPAKVRPLLERNIGFFAVTAGPAELIVHLYRWDDYNDSKRRLAAIATPDRTDYFVAARALLLRQETSYLDLAPIAALNPCWGDGRDWLPNEPLFANSGEATALAVSESVLDFVPGGLVGYWEGYRRLDSKTMDIVRAGLIGVFVVTTGLLHRVIHYHRHHSLSEADDHRRMLAKDPAWNAFSDSYRPAVMDSYCSYLGPSPVPWMRPLFEPIDWAAT
jgi:hypothetical protein